MLVRTATVENDEVLQEMRNCAPIEPSLILLSVHPKETTIPKITNCSIKLVTTAEPQDQLRCPSVNGWMKNRWCAHTMEYSSATKE